MSDCITIERKTFLDLCAACAAAGHWMATQAPCTDWANRVRQDLHSAHQAAVTETEQPIARDNPYERQSPDGKTWIGEAR